MLVNRSIPQSTVIPELAYPDVLEAVDWLCKAYGFTLRIGIGSHRAQLNVGVGAVVLTEPHRGAGDGDLIEDGESHRRLQDDSAHSVMVRVDNVDHHYERAIQYGARVIHLPANYSYGERQYTVEDLVGRRWTFSQSVADVAPQEWGGMPGQL